MSALGIDIDLRTDFLEDHWGDDEAACELDHTGTPCSVTVSAVFRSCVSPQLICAKAATDLSEIIADETTPCTCGQSIASHWSVIPV